MKKPRILRNIFTLYILELTPNHLELFVKLNPNYVLNYDEYLILILLNLYELTIAEQVYIDTIKPTLNENESIYAKKLYLRIIRDLQVIFRVKHLTIIYPRTKRFLIYV